MHIHNVLQSITSHRGICSGFLAPDLQLSSSCYILKLHQRAFELRRIWNQRHKRCFRRSHRENQIASIQSIEIWKKTSVAESTTNNAGKDGWSFHIIHSVKNTIAANLSPVNFIWINVNGSSKSREHCSVLNFFRKRNERFFPKSLGNKVADNQWI